MRASLALVLTLAACSTGTTDTGLDSDTALGDPTLAFVTPTATDTVHGTSVDVRIAVSHVSLVPRGMGTGQGTEGFVFLTLDDTTTSEINALTTTMSGVFAGTHTLHAELLDPSGASFDPAVTADVTFTSVDN